MFCAGVKGSLTPKRVAVAGMSCISPCAPARETALGLNADSAWMTARTSASSTPYCAAAADISLA